MPEQTTEVTEAAVEAAAKGLTAGFGRVYDGDRKLAAAALEAAAPILTAPLREELEEAKKRERSQRERADAAWKEYGCVARRRDDEMQAMMAQEASANLAQIEAAANELGPAMQRADSAERRLEEATKAITELVDLRGWLRRHAGHPPDERADAYRIAAGSSLWNHAERFLATLQGSQVDGEAAGHDFKPADETHILQEALRRIDLTIGASGDEKPDAQKLGEIRSLIYRTTGLVEGKRLAAPTPEQPEEPTCGGSGEVIDTPTDPSWPGGLGDALKSPCPGCPDCSTKESGGEGEARSIAETGEMPPKLDEAIGILRSHEEHDENCGIPHPADPDQSSRCTCGLESRVQRAEDLIAEQFDEIIEQRDSRLTKEAVREKLRSPQMAERCAEEIGRRHPCRSTPIKQARAALDRAAAAFGDDQPSKGGGS